jgi:hypothetical protein
MLAILDGQLMPQVKSSDLRAFLEEDVRPTLQSQLDAAGDVKIPAPKRPL